MMLHNDRLTHMVYEASLDNSLLPELILELTEHVQMAANGRLIESDGKSGLNDLMAHFRRALEISEKMVALQERESDLDAVLSTLSVGVALLDEDGQIIVSNRAMQETGFAIEHQTTLALCGPVDGTDTRQRPLSHWVAETNLVDAPKALFAGNGADQFTLLPRAEATRIRRYRYFV